MQHKTCLVTAAGAFLLVLGSTSYGADLVSSSPTVSSPDQIYLIRENPFFNMHIEKAVQHAREAEIAGNMGEPEVLVEHARMSLMQAREAQRAGNVPGLNEGMANLKKAVSLSTWLPQTSTRTSSTELSEASMQTSSAEMPQGLTQIPSTELSEASAQTPSAQITGDKAPSATQSADAALRSATGFVREARKNLSQAGGMKYVEIKPQGAVTVSN